MISDKEKITFIKNNYNNYINSSKVFTYDLSIFLTNMCNLNCTNCQTFCVKNKSDYILTFKNFKQNIDIIKKNDFNSCQHITLFGGEPLLNPELKQICLYLRQIFPNILITIFTNGILLKELDLSFFKKLNIEFLITLYPLDYITEIEKKEKEMQLLRIPFKIHGTRPFFSKTNFNMEGLSDPEHRFFTCGHAKTPFSFYLFNNKIFKCAIEPNFPNINLPLISNDYIDIKNFSLKNLKKLALTQLEACKYCGINEQFGTDEIICWNHQGNVSSVYFQTLRELYLNNYEKYYNLCHNISYSKKYLLNNYFISKTKDDGYSSDPYNMLINRFFKGLADIFMPFDSNLDKEILKNFKQKIQEQTIFKKLNFYFVSTDKNKEIKDLVYKTFPPSSIDIKGNFFFLEEKNYHLSYLTFLNNSYCNKKITLELNQETIKNLLNINYLEGLIYNDG